MTIAWGWTKLQLPHHQERESIMQPFHFHHLNLRLITSPTLVGVFHSIKQESLNSPSSLRLETAGMMGEQE